MRVLCREQTLRGLAAATALLVAKGTAFVRRFLLWVDTIILLYWDRILLCHMQISYAKAAPAIQKGTWPRLANSSSRGQLWPGLVNETEVAWFWEQLTPLRVLSCSYQYLCLGGLLASCCHSSLWMHCLYKLPWWPQMNLFYQHILSAAGEQLAWTYRYGDIFNSATVCVMLSRLGTAWSSQNPFIAASATMESSPESTVIMLPGASAVHC